VKELTSRSLKPIGIEHSHGWSDVHHSNIDDETALRLLPAMAEWNFERPAPTARTPSVTAPDSALLPLPDGTSQQFTLLGPEAPGGWGRPRVRWGQIRTELTPASAKDEPRATVEGDRLLLQAAGVSLALVIPADATLVAKVLDLAPVRVAYLYSLVVNVRRETYAQVLTVCDALGRSMIHMDRCAVEIVGRSRSPSPRREKRIEASLDRNGADARDEHDRPSV
jgi:hypothetical protein